MKKLTWKQRHPEAVREQAKLYYLKHKIEIAARRKLKYTKWKSYKGDKCGTCGVDIVSCNKSGYCIKHRVGDKHPSWRGDKVGYDALHSWVKKHKPRPRECERCGVVKTLQLSNTNNQYDRDPSHWEYLCRSCHCKKDGHIKNLGEYAIKKTDRDVIKLGRC